MIQLLTREPSSEATFSSRTRCKVSLSLPKVETSSECAANVTWSLSNSHLPPLPVEVVVYPTLRLNIYINQRFSRYIRSEHWKHSSNVFFPPRTSSETSHDGRNCNRTHLYISLRGLSESLGRIFDKNKKPRWRNVFGGLAEGRNLGLEALQEVFAVPGLIKWSNFCQDFSGLESDGLRQNGAVLVQLEKHLRGGSEASLEWLDISTESFGLFIIKKRTLSFLSKTEPGLSKSSGSWERRQDCVQLLFSLIGQNLPEILLSIDKLELIPRKPVTQS